MATEKEDDDKADVEKDSSGNWWNSLMGSTAAGSIVVILN